MSDDWKLADVDPSKGFWVFAYGSLMWNPGFPSRRRETARLAGFRRAFCLSSVHYRGTPQEPGLVLALDEAGGTECHGVGYHVYGSDAEEALDYIRRRELVSAAYREVTLPVTLATDEVVTAVTYAVDRDHEQYVGNQTLEMQAEVISRAIGPAGSNLEYLQKTLESLDILGVHDADIVRLGGLVDNLCANSGD